MKPSRYVLGTCQLGKVENPTKFINQCLELGVNTIDTGWGYGGSEHFSEKAIGKAISKKRDQVYLIDKFPFYWKKGKTSEQIFQEQLDCLKTDYLDCYMLHAVYDNKNGTEDDIKEAIDFVQGLKAKGKVKSIGFSAHVDMFKAEHIINMANWDSCMFAYNVLSGPVHEVYPEIQVWENPGLDGFKYAKKKKIYTYAMMPFEAGRVFDISRDKAFAQYCFDYVRAAPEIDSILIGSSRIERIKECITGHGKD